MAASLIVMTGIVLAFFREAALLASFVLVAIALTALGICLMTESPIEPTTQREAPLRVNRVLADPWEKESNPRKSRIVKIEPPDPDLVEISEQGAKLETWLSGRKLGIPAPPPAEGSDRPI